MADAGFFRGTTSEQDARFSDKNKKLMKHMKFEKSLAEKVDMDKVNLDIIKPWITKRITELLSGIEDEVLIAYIFELLESSKNPDPKELQIAVTGFLNGKNARIFMGELWTHLISAQENIGGIPAEFLEKKKEEIRKRKEESERIQESLRKAQTQSVEPDSTSSKDIPDLDRIHRLAKRAKREASPEAFSSDLFSKTPSMKDQDHIRKSLVGYLKSAAATPVGRDKPGWYAEHEKHSEISKTSVASVLLIGDSIIQGLARFPKIWNKYFAPLKALNFGLGGDRTQNVLWRVINGEIPINAQMIVVHCGTNNTDRDDPKDIACGIASIGMIFQEHKPNSKIILTGLLPRDLQRSHRREQVAKVNRYLKRVCSRGHIRNFYYLKPDPSWVLPDGTLNTTYYFHDYLHLSEEGDEKFSKDIYDIITKVYSGTKIEMSSDSELSDEEDFTVQFEDKYNKAIATAISSGAPKSPSRRSYSPRRRRRSPSPRKRSPRRSPSPRRRSPRRSPSPRRRSPRRRYRRSNSRSRSRSPRRRRGRRRESSSRSPPVVNKNLLELTKQRSPSPPPSHARSHGEKAKMIKREESEERVKIEPADEGLMKEDSPSTYKKSDKTQNRAYRRQQSESDVSENDTQENRPSNHARRKASRSMSPSRSPIKRRSRSPIGQKRKRSRSPMRESASRSPVRRRRQNRSRSFSRDKHFSKRSPQRKNRSSSRSPVRRRQNKSPRQSRRSPSKSPVTRKRSTSRGPIRKRRISGRSSPNKRNAAKFRPSESPVDKHRSSKKKMRNPSNSPVRKRNVPSKSPIRHRRSADKIHRVVQQRDINRRRNESDSPQPRKKKRQPESSDESTPPPETTRKERAKRKDIEMREAKMRERDLAERLRNRHKKRQNREKKASESSGDGDKVSSRKKLLEEADRRLAATSSESDTELKSRRHHNEKHHVLVEKMRGRKESSLESSDDNRKSRNQQEKIPRRSAHVAKERQPYRVNARGESSDEDENEETRPQNPQRRRGKNNDVQRRRDENVSENSDNEIEDKRQVVIKDKRRDVSSTPEVRAPAQDENESEEVSDVREEEDEIKRASSSRPNHAESDDDDELDYEADEMHPQPSDNLSRVDDRESSAELATHRIKVSEKEGSEYGKMSEVVRKSVSEEDELSESSTEEAKRKRRRSKKEKKRRRRHHKTSKSKKRKSKKHRHSSSEESDSSMASDADDSDFEKELREKALKSIKRKKRDKRNSSASDDDSG